MTNEDFDLVPFAEVKAIALKNPDVQEAYNDIQVRKALAAQLKTARKAMHLTQQYIALKTGIKKQNISRIENGLVSPNFSTLNKYAAALGGSFVFQLNHLT
ncbi:helix-turn-helix transcriptional regulator [Sodalis ligni]|uniref:helix-turn-helix domain-containing protein n=1 Tax=Sodalis ligni TaxID=2697027 RepID=UPI00193F9DD1|nr:helix-turn-helix transcriptional regulator [Sodalis ligni]QWA11101.1 helix-turn-helix transcriptional regulator [Sodalis ligni]